MATSSSASFDSLYARLNAGQKLAVDSIEGPVMVMAGPGTGKTTILTLRIANILLKTDTPASGILALTFTDSGQKAMRVKLRTIIGSQADEVNIFTYHGFAAHIMMGEFREHFPHLSRSKQITEIEAEGLVREILKDKTFTRLRPIGEPDFYIRSILKTISDAKKEAWTPEIIQAFAADEAEQVKNDEESISTRGVTKGKLKAAALKRIEKCEKTVLFAAVYEAYEAKKQAERKIDFDDLIFELILALKKDELLLRLLQEKYLYVLVDEHQDTNDAQNQLIRLIVDFFETPNLFIVGDEKQAIYRFQGASVDNFLKFQKMWGSMKIISLEDNYRSHQSILDASFAMIENNYGEGEYEELRFQLRSGTGQEARPVDMVTAGNTEALEQYLAEELRRIYEEEPGKTVAVIVRRNRDVERVMSLLEAENIPAEAERGADIFSHPIGALYFALLEYLADPGAIESLAKTVAGGLWNLSFEQAATLIRRLRSGDVTGMEKDMSVLADLRRQMTRAGGVEFLVLAGTASGLATMATRTPLSAEVWRSIMALAMEISYRNSVTDPAALIAELLAYKKSAATKSIKIPVGKAKSQIAVMTAHSSKGLEYDYVWLPYATEDSWMPRKMGAYFVMPREKDEGDEVRDARRLFYVALTRARSHATILLGKEEGTGRLLTPLRFIDELDPNHIKRIELPAVFANSVAKPHGDLVAKQTAEIVEYTKRILLEKGLSVTALNHFCHCPSEFFYKSILKLPEAPSGSSQKGNAMHEAFDQVWRLPAKSEAAIEVTIIGVVTDFFKRSLLPLHEKDQVQEELIKHAPIVAKALFDHFQTAGKVSTETWMQTTLAGSYAGEDIQLGLHGKLDAVIEQEKFVLVFDYKTREGMSVNAIKGETKNSDGNYFRQLVFYKLLIAAQARAKHKSIVPALVFIKPDSKGRCPIVSLPIDKADEDNLKAELQTLIDSVWSGTFLTDTCDDQDCVWCSLKKETLHYGN